MQNIAVASILSFALGALGTWALIRSRKATPKKVAAQKDTKEAAAAAPPPAAVPVTKKKTDAEDYKMVFLVRQDLSMTKGKIAAQVIFSRLRETTRDAHPFLGVTVRSCDAGILSPLQANFSELGRHVGRNRPEEDRVESGR